MIPLNTRFKRWVVIEPAAHVGGKGRYICKCDCGTERIVYAQSLRAGTSKSCGCLHRQKVTKHGHSRDRFYNVWHGMMSRCYDENADSFSNYGARGITVCDEWRNGPDEFVRWCHAHGKIPANRTLERKDNNGPYAPWNCCFATSYSQARNKRNNVRIEHNGESLCFVDFVKKYGVVSMTVAKERVYRLGYSHKDAALKPHRYKAKRLVRRTRRLDAKPVDVKRLLETEGL
jgi:hypothetical protein